MKAPVVKALMRSVSSAICALALIAALSPLDRAYAADNAAAAQQPNGMWTDKDGSPTFKIEPDGTVDWYTYEGFIQVPRPIACNAMAPMG